MKSLIAICVLTTAASFAQVIAIQDNSPSDSPITFSGTISFGAPDTNSPCTINAHNNSIAHKIIAYVVQLKVVRGDGFMFNHNVGHDHFFADDATLSMMSPAPQSDFNPEIRCERFGRSHTNNWKATPTTPSMTLTTMMVQFDDGTIWGNPTNIAAVMFQRNDAIAYLKTLSAAANITQALATEPALTVQGETLPHNGRALTWALLRDRPDAATQTAEVARRLAVAQQRASWIK